MSEKELNLSIKELLEIASNTYENPIPNDVLSNIADFLMLRLSNIMLDKGLRYDIVNSLKHHINLSVHKILKIAFDIQRWLEEDKSEVFTTLIRGQNLLIDQLENPVNEELFTHSSERELYDIINTNDKQINSLIEDEKYYEALCLNEIYVDAINKLFDNVMIMDKDELVKLNRLSLLKMALSKINIIMDINQIVYK